VNGESALCIVHQAEGLVRLVDADDVHVAGGVRGVGTHLAVDLYEALHDDCFYLAGVEGILEAVAEEDDEGEAVAEFMGAGGGTRGVGAREFVEEPVRGSAEALLVFFPA
jgi:hypothetical protein